MKKIILFTNLLLIVLVIHSCTDDKTELSVSTQGNPNAQVRFSRDIQPILIHYCYGQGAQICHATNSNQGSNGNFTSYAGIKAKVDNGALQARALTPNGGMPPPFSVGPQVLAPADLQKLKDWVAAGAPDN